MNLTSQKPNNRSFTIIEVMVAIFIITTGMLGAFSLIQQTVFFTVTGSSRLAAAYLAQEGIEIVRNIRDTNWLGGFAWDDGLDVGTHEADYNDLALSPYNNNYLKIGNGFYNYDSGSLTKFKRKITITPDPISMPSKLEVSVLVEWQERGSSHQVTVKENLYNWR
ncbi:prepilin-type N-terminal cleavage/methylation domain-containing protein [Patescibacteria group bacterium]|nr:prepilin-type N-terminal cleavage/methylation domain-containing protein [Patescibacteria group bacterium]